MRDAIKIESSGGNVFADLEMPNSSELLIKAELVHKISGLIATQKMTQVEAAECLRIDISEAADLLRGKLSEFSRDRLLEFLNALDLAQEEPSC